MEQQLSWDYLQPYHTDVCFCCFVVVFWLIAFPSPAGREVGPGSASQGHGILLVQRRARQQRRRGEEPVSFNDAWIVKQNVPDFLTHHVFSTPNNRNMKLAGSQLLRRLVVSFLVSQLWNMACADRETDVINQWERLSGRLRTKPPGAEPHPEHTLEKLHTFKCKVPSFKSGYIGPPYLDNQAGQDKSVTF